MNARCFTTIFTFMLVLLVGCNEEQAGESDASQTLVGSKEIKCAVAGRPLDGKPRSKAELLAVAAMEQVGKTTIYDPSYIELSYPGGDVPIERGVCTDVVIRALRKCGVDLQIEIQEDMKANFESYPNLWGLNRADSNIDHRRALNIATFLRGKGKAVPITNDGRGYLPGDIVVWRLPNGVPHIGIVSNVPVKGGDRYKVVHNIGAGTQLEDVLFMFEITGHFRYFQEVEEERQPNKALQRTR